MLGPGSNTQEHHSQTLCAPHCDTCRISTASPASGQVLRSVMAQEHNCYGWNKTFFSNFFCLNVSFWTVGSPGWGRWDVPVGTQHHGDAGWARGQCWAGRQGWELGAGCFQHHQQGPRQQSSALGKPSGGRGRGSAGTVLSPVDTQARCNLGFLSCMFFSEPKCFCRQTVFELSIDSVFSHKKKSTGL